MPLWSLVHTLSIGSAPMCSQRPTSSLGPVSLEHFFSACCFVCQFVHRAMLMFCRFVARSMVEPARGLLYNGIWVRDPQERRRCVARQEQPIDLKAVVLA